MTNAKKRQELLTLAERWTGPAGSQPGPRPEARYWAREECAEELRTLVDRLFPVKPPAEQEPEEPHPIVTFPVIGGGTYGVGAAKVEELAKLYEVPVPFLLEQLGIVAAKIQAGAVSKKTRKGMPRALFAWSQTAKTIHQRHYAGPPSSTAKTAPPTNGTTKPRLVRMAGEDVALYQGQTYRRAQWPAEYGPWPGGA